MHVFEAQKLSLRAAAAKHGVTRSTMHDYVVGKSKVDRERLVVWVLHRHPKVAIQRLQAIQASNASACTIAMLNKWFYGFEQFLLQHDLR